MSICMAEVRERIGTGVEGVRSCLLFILWGGDLRRTRTDVEVLLVQWICSGGVPRERIVVAAVRHAVVSMRHKGAGGHRTLLSPAAGTKREQQNRKVDAAETGSTTYPMPTIFFSGLTIQAPSWRLLWGMAAERGSEVGARLSRR